MTPEMQALIDAVETWQTLKVGLAKEWSLNGYRNFSEVHNYHTRKMIRLLEKEDPEFWSSLAELATQAATLTTPRAKFIVGGKDMTNV